MNAVTKTLINRSTINRIVRCNAHAGRASWIQESRPQALAAAMLRAEDLQPARIPFDGFYNSFLTAAFDEGIEHELEWRLEEADSVACSLTRDELEDCARDCVISSADAVEIARAWVSRYEGYLSDAANGFADENDQQDQVRPHFASYNAEANAHGYWPWGDDERLGSFLLRGRAPLGSGHDVECGTNRRPSRFHLSGPAAYRIRPRRPADGRDRHAGERSALKAHH